MANPTPAECASVSDFNNPACITVMSNYCGTDDFFGDNYIEKWQGDTFTSTCRRYTELNVGNQVQYVPVTDAMVRRYLITDANPITYPQQGSLIFDPAIETVVDVCQSYPGACDAVLNQVCNGFIREDMRDNVNLGRLCGCFLDDNEYDAYQGSFGVEKICDPVCTLQSAVKPRNPENQFQTLSCNQTICVIDDVKIQLLNDSTVGDINFAQACSSCSGGGSGGCQCFISDVSITGVQSTIGDINFDQQCGGNPFCYQSDANGVPQKVDCAVLEGDSGGGTTTSRISTTTLLIIIALITAIIIIMIIIIALATRRSGGTPSFVPPSSGLYPSYSAI